jgi:hypothetical protein
MFIARKMFYFAYGRKDFHSDEITLYCYLKERFESMCIYTRRLDARGALLIAFGREPPPHPTWKQRTRAPPPKHRNLIPSRTGGAGGHLLPPSSSLLLLLPARAPPPPAFTTTRSRRRPRHRPSAHQMSRPPSPPFLKL